MISPKNNTDKKKVNMEKMTTWFIFIILAFAVIVLFFTAKSMFFPQQNVVGETTTESDHFGAGGFTEYDLALAKELMDKDGDGKCDVCGMDMDFCIESGQLQCNMGGKTGKLNIGVLDKTKQKNHYHADFKVYIDGQEVDFAQEQFFVKSRFIHVENDVQGDTGKVLHMHATGVPLWVFFESVTFEFPEDMIAYVNGEKIDNYKDYVFNDLDKILITDGRGNLQEQLDSVTDFAKNH